MRKSNLLFILLFCLCLVGCSKNSDSVNVSGAFGTGESVSESKVEESETDKFLIKDDVTISTEEIDDTKSNINLSSLQQAKVNEIEQSIQGIDITKDDIEKLINESISDLSESEVSILATEITDKIKNQTTSETLSSELVYKYATSYETNEIVIDEEAPERFYSDEELAIMHSEAESLYQQQQIAETFEFDD